MKIILHRFVVSVLAIVVLPTLSIAQHSSVLGWIVKGAARTTVASGSTVFIGGDFYGLARARDITGAFGLLDSTGQVVATAHADARVAAMAVDGFGRLYIGGDFGRIGAAPRSGLARLMPDGSLDESFAISLTAASSHPGLVTHMAIAGTRLVLSGGFVAVQGQRRNGLAAIDLASNTVLPWQPVLGGDATALAAEGSRIYLSALFAGTSARSITALDASTLAPVWSTPLDSLFSRVSAMAIHGDALYLVGLFNQAGGLARRNAAALDLDTGRPLPWAPQVGGLAHAVAADDTRVFIGGEFRTVNNASQQYFAVTDHLGVLSGWRPQVGEPVDSLEILSGRLLAGGRFGRIDGMVRPGVAAYDLATESLSTWAPRANGPVLSFAAAGSLIAAGGDFSSLNSVPRRGIVALSAVDGSILPWQAGYEGVPDALAVNSDTLFASGERTEDRNVWNPGDPGRLAAFALSTGETRWSLDISAPLETLVASSSAVYGYGPYLLWSPSLPRSTYASWGATTGVLTPWAPCTGPCTWGPALAVHATRVFIGGESLRAVDATTGAPTGFLATLELPRIFENRGVRDLEVRGTTLYVGGAFVGVNGQARANLAAFDLGTDTLMPWNPAPNATVFDLTASGSDVYLAGRFTSVGGVPRQGLAAVGAGGAVLPWAPAGLPANSLPFGLSTPAEGVALIFSLNNGTTNVHAAMWSFVNPSPPPPPIPLSSVVIGNNVWARWDTTPGVNGPILHWVDAGGAPGATEVTLPLGVVPELFVAGAPTGTFHVRAASSNLSGRGAPSADMVVTPGVCAAPTAPDLAAQVAGSSVMLTWSASARASSYRLEAGFASGQSDAAMISVAGQAFTTVAPFGTYFVRVRGVSSCGVSPPSNEVVVAVSPPPVPAAPLSLTATVTGSTVQLAWMPGTGGPVNGFVIEAGSASGQNDVTVVPVGTQTAVIATNVAPGRYFVRARAVGPGGTSGPSNEVEVIVEP